MTREELVQALRRLKVETGSLACLGCGHEHNCSLHGCAVIREAAEALTPPPNDPLTSEQLREMDGEPVWGVFQGEKSRYMIIQWHNSEFFKTFECGFLLAEEYGKTWLAYRRRPEGAVKDV